MTANQIAYHNMQENIRHNREQEAISHKSIDTKRATDIRGQNFNLAGSALRAAPRLIGNAVTGIGQAIAAALI